MLARTLIRPHGEEARARDAVAILDIQGAPSRTMRAAAPQVVPTSSFETHRTVGKGRLCDAPQDEVSTHCGGSVKAAIAFTLAEAPA